MKHPKLTERQIEQQIVDLLGAHGWIVLRTNRFSSGNAVVVQGSIEVGIPDLQARKPYHSYVENDLQRVVWIEVKRPGGKVSPEQEQWHLLARRRGETVIVAESVEDAAAVFYINLRKEAA